MRRGVTGNGRGKGGKMKKKVQVADSADMSDQDSIGEMYGEFGKT